MDKPLLLCGRTFTPELVNQLNIELEQQPLMQKNALARILCEHLGWFSPAGRADVSSAKVALRKLEKRGLLRRAQSARRTKRSHRLRPSGQRLPALSGVPGRVGQIRGLHLYWVSGHEDGLHGLWNDLMIQQHPCGEAPLVGAQLRYLVGSEQGWLGAWGFGPAAFVLGARDQWIGWSPAARVSQLNRVIGLSRFLIRREDQCGNLASKVLSLALERVGPDWLARYGVDPCWWKPLWTVPILQAAVLARPIGCGLAAVRDGDAWGRRDLSPAQRIFGFIRWCRRAEACCSRKVHRR